MSVAAMALGCFCGSFCYRLWKNLRLNHARRMQGEYVPGTVLKSLQLGADKLRAQKTARGE